jgi:hypothetical protein
MPHIAALGTCYKQLNSSVGAFGAATLIASTNAIESASGGDVTFTAVDSQLQQLDVARDQLAQQIKGELEDAEFGNRPAGGAPALIHSCEGLIDSANQLASSS